MFLELFAYRIIMVFFLVHLIVAHRENGKQHHFKKRAFLSTDKGGSYNMAFDKNPAFLSQAALDNTVQSWLLLMLQSAMTL